MCYSALVWADYRRYMREYNACLHIRDFYELFWKRNEGGRITLPRGIEDAFEHPQNDEEQEILDLLEAYRRTQRAMLEQDLIGHRTRLEEAERKLATRKTKAAQESKRIAQNKIGRTEEKLANLARKTPGPTDSRIYPGQYVPVMVMEDGQRVIKPMRYQCRPAGKPTFFDTKFPGTYNARKDSLSGFWKDLFGYSHGVVIVSAFFESVSRHRLEQRTLAPGEIESKVELEFSPVPPRDMLIACLWSKWTGPGEDDLLSFAFITDEPPVEVAAAGHDRCIVPIKAGNLEAWLNPDPNDLAKLYAILDDREPLFFEHRPTRADDA